MVEIFMNQLDLYNSRQVHTNRVQEAVRCTGWCLYKQRGKKKTPDIRFKQGNKNFPRTASQSCQEAISR